MEANQKPWERIERLMDAGEEQALEAFVDEMPHAEVVSSVFHLSEERAQQLLSLLTPETAAEVLEDLPDVHAAALLEDLPADGAAAIVAELPSDDVADVLSELDAEDAEEILEQMDAEDAAEARELISYDEDSAGGLMMTEFLSYSASFSVGDILDNLRAHADEFEGYNVQFLYIVNAHQRLQGVLRMRDIVLADRDDRAGDIMIAAEAVQLETPLDELAEFFEDHELSAVPVLDPTRRLVGVVRRRAVYDTVAERAEEDRLRAQGIISGEELRTMPTGLRSRRRLSWLSINIVLNVIAASIIAMYEETLAAVIVLAVFLPMVSDMSGCSGNQAVAVSLRELTLGVIGPLDAFRVWLKEVSVGLINGVALGTLLGVAAWLWKGNPYLGLVIGGALALNTVIAVSIGGTVPLILKYLKIDPAVASGPVLTTITDVCGFFLVLAFATAMLPLLQVA